VEIEESQQPERDIYGEDESDHWDHPIICGRSRAVTGREGPTASRSGARVMCTAVKDAGPHGGECPRHSVSVRPVWDPHARELPTAGVRTMGPFR
jgi:hypothetical protein